ncbi:unnamed protein product [Trichobilharzia regenti]|nr:unnamed protein product [Trichobilharzia regenti]
MPDDATEHEIALLGIPFGLLENMVLSKKANQVTLRGRTLVMQYSKHQHLELHSENSSIGSAIQNANCIVQQDLSGANSGIPTTVLRVVVDNIMGQQINHTILHKNNPLTEDELMSLRRPTGGSGGHQNNNPSHVSSNFQNSIVPSLSHQGIHLPVGMIAPPNTSNLGISELTAQLAALAQQSGLALTPAAAAATASFMALTSQNSGPGAQSMSGSPNLSAILAALQGGAVQTGVLPHMSAGNASVIGSVQSPISSHVTPVGVRPPPNNNGSTVLIVSNLNEDRVYPDALFTLFALQYLNGQRLWDKPMKIAVSRHNIVQLPKEETENGLTKDYTNSLLHRFRKPNSKNFQNIYPPSHVLHLSNIPPSVVESDIRVLFATKGFEVTGFRFMKDNKMALVQLETIDLAIQALIVSACI